MSRKVGKKHRRLLGGDEDHDIMGSVAIFLTLQWFLPWL